MKFFLTHMNQLPHMVSLKPGFTYKMEEVEGVYEPKNIPDADYKHGDELYLLDGNRDDGKIIRYTIIDTNPAPTVVPVLPPPTSTPGNTPIAELGFSKRLLKIFENGKRGGGRHSISIVILEDFKQYTEEDLRYLLGFGSAALRETKDVLARHSVWLKPSVDFLATSIDELGLSLRDTNALRSVNICTIGDLIQKTDKEVFETTVSRKTTDEIVEKLATYGLCLSVKLR